MEFLIAFGIIGAALGGYLLGKKFSSNEVEKAKLVQQLSDKTAELDAFHSKVNSHFEKTADLFNHVSDSYQSLYDHMATSSTQLCASQTFQALPKSSSEGFPDDSVSSPQSNSKEELFDANHLYKAHDYRNQQAENDAEDNKIDDPKIIEIAKAKENVMSDAEAQALDYAIKAKGVVNHNSLDIEGVKNS